MIYNNFRLRDNLEKSEQMEQEKMMIDDHVQHLEASLKVRH